VGGWGGVGEASVRPQQANETASDDDEKSRARCVVGGIKPKTGQAERWGMRRRRRRRRWWWW